MEEEIRLGELAKKGLEFLTEEIKKIKKRRIQTPEDLRKYVEVVLKGTLPDDFKDFEARWEDPNKIILEFKKQVKEKMMKVFE